MTDTLSEYIFDIIIPVGPKDVDIVEKQVEYTKKNIIGYRNIYIIHISDKLQLDGCITITEDMYPFNLGTIRKYHGIQERNGWYLQQLLKLYSGFVIPGILDKFLVIDSDTFFIKPTEFYKDNKCLYNFSREYHPPYFAHMERLLPGLHKVDSSKSGICHHMIFEKKYLKELFDKVEELHGDKFYIAFLKCVVEYNTSGASEYEIYFNYMLDNHSDKIVVRELRWENTRGIVLDKGYDYISYHWYNR